MAFGSLAIVKKELGIPDADASEDSRLNLYIRQLSTLIELHCHRKFAGLTDYDEIYSGNGTLTLPLNKRPVTEITAIYENDAAFFGSVTSPWPSTSLLVSGTDYALQVDSDDGTSDCGMVQRITGVWSIPINYAYGVISPFVGPGNGNIRVQYTAGFDNTPDDVQLALFTAVAAVRNSKNYGQLIRSESAGDGAGSNNYSLSGESKVGILPREVTSILAHYINFQTA